MSFVQRLVPALLVVAALARPVHAQLMGGNGYLMGAPEGFLSFHGGFDAASAGGDLFADVRNNLTLKRGSFASPNVRADLGVQLSSRLAMVISLGFSKSSARSEYRNFVDNNDRPIEQTTDFQRVPLTLSLKYALTSPGRSVGRYAWIPSRFTPYVGAGFGATYYQFEQYGDFVNFANNNVFATTVTSERWGMTGHAFAGADLSLSPRFSLVGEARYTAGRAGVGGSFEGFNSIDLSGLTTTVGLAVRF